MKYTVKIIKNDTNEEAIKCECNALIVGVSIEDAAFAFHISGSESEMTAIVNEINTEIDKIFGEEPRGE